jgi:hypothetical protein
MVGQEHESASGKSEKAPRRARSGDAEAGGGVGAPVGVVVDAVGEIGGEVARAAVNKLMSTLTSGWSDQYLDPVGNALDVIHKDDEQILAGLDEIKSQLQAVNAALQQVRQGITDIQQQITEEAYQARLLDYTKQRTVIVQNFTSLTQAMLGCGDPSPDVRKRAVGDLRRLTEIDIADEVAEAMMNIHTDLYGDPSVGLKSLIEYQQQIVNDELARFAADSTHLVVDGLSGTGKYFLIQQMIRRENYHDGPIVWPDTTFSDSWRIISKAPSVVLAPTITKTVVAAFTAMLRIQTQALFFLYMAWRGGPQEPQLQQHAARINLQAQAIADFFRYFTSTSYDALMLSLLVGHGQYPSLQWLDDMHVKRDPVQDWNWPYGSGWMWFDAANGNPDWPDDWYQPARQAVLANLRPGSGTFTGSVVVLSPHQVFSDADGGDFGALVAGWRWSRRYDVQLPSPSAYASPVVAPLMLACLGHLLPPPQPPTGYVQAPATHWAQRTPRPPNWVDGNHVRYAVSFYNAGGESLLGPWCPWLEIRGFALPLLTNVPTDTAGFGTQGRRVYRQFTSDAAAGRMFRIADIKDETTTLCQDEWD